MAPTLNQRLNGNVMPTEATELPRRGPGRPPKPTDETAVVKVKAGRPPKLTADDQLVLLRLHEKGRKAGTIARILSRPDREISTKTVVRYLRQVSVATADVQRALARLRMRAVQSWETAMETGEKFGKHAPAKDLLIATGTIRQDAPSDRVIIVVGNGTQAIGELPAIPAEFTDVTPPALPATSGSALPPASDPEPEQ
jgi:hypothetical protein